MTSLWAWLAVTLTMAFVAVAVLAVVDEVWRHR